jgi:hypothetical protein
MSDQAYTRKRPCSVLCQKQDYVQPWCERQRPNLTLTLSPILISKESGLLWNCYISGCIRNCRVLNLLEFADKWHGTRYRDMMNCGLNS